MKFNFLVAMCLCISGLVQAQDKSEKAGLYLDEVRTEMNDVETEMVAEINLVRTKPNEYIPFVEAYIKENIKDDKAEIESARELITLLKSTAPMKSLQAAQCLFFAARDHGINQAPTGNIQHQDTNGKAPWDRIEAICSASTNSAEKGLGGSQNIASSSVGSSQGYAANNARDINIMLLIDHGIKTKSNRKNILNPDWTHTAAFSYNTKSEKFMKEYGVNMYSVDYKWIQSFGRLE